MIDLKTFRKIKELKEKGVTAKRIIEDLHISKGMYYKWGLSHIVKRNKGELPMYRIEGTHPKSISETTFNKAKKESILYLKTIEQYIHKVVGLQAL